MNKTQLLSASRAGLSSVVATDAGASKTQVVSNIGAVTQQASASTSIRFVIHPFP